MITPEDIKDGWQPCRFITAHDWSKHVEPRNQEEVNAISRAVLLARPYIPTTYELEFHYKPIGCDAKKFYIVDTKPLGEIRGGRYVIACEHEILTD